MDDAVYGMRDKRGDWRPSKRAEYPPVFVWPARPAAFAKWLFGWDGYIFPWNAVYAAIGIALWLFATPSMETVRHFAPGWIAYLLVRNALLVLVFFGAFHLRLYMQKAQGTSFKYNSKWPSTDNSAFLFGNQTIDNLIWTFGSAVPIWTAYEVLTLWTVRQRLHPLHQLRRSPDLLRGAVFLLIPVWRDLHFYLVHRLIHSHALYHARAQAAS